MQFGQFSVHVAGAVVLWLCSLWLALLWLCSKCGWLWVILAGWVILDVAS